MTTETYTVQARLGDAFEDITVTAASARQAIAKARKLTTLQHRYTSFAV